MPDNQKEMLDQMLNEFQKKETEDNVEQETEEKEVLEKEEDIAEEQETESSESSEQEEQEEQNEKEGEEEKEESEADSLRKTIDNLASNKPQIDDSVEEKEEKGEDKEKEKSEEETKEEAKEAFDLTDQEYDEILSDKRKFADFLNKFGGRIREQAREDALRDIPGVVQKTTNRQQALMQKKQEFYNSNPDLEQHKNYVGYKANQIYSESPDLNIDQLFEKTAEAVRKDLAISKEAVSKEEERIEKQSNKKKKPAFAGSTRGSRSSKTDERDDMQKDLDKMIDSIE